MIHGSLWKTALGLTFMITFKALILKFNGFLTAFYDLQGAFLWKINKILKFIGFVLAKVGNVWYNNPCSEPEGIATGLNSKFL